MTAARVLLAVASLALVPAAQAQTIDAASLYQRNCAQCHDSGVNRAPQRDAFLSMAPERVLAAMETGSMVTMANNRTAAERRALAELLTGKRFGTALSTVPPASAMCRDRSSAFNPASGAQWNAWGRDATNARFQTSAGLSAADVPRLKLKWAFAFPGDLQSYSQATLAGGRLFIGSWGGKVYSLDAPTGCVHWFFDAGAGVRSAISIADVGSRHVAFFGDMAANVYAVDASTGQLIWRSKIDDFAVARVSGSPTVHEGRVYVGVAAGEEGAAAVPTYECCRFRGSIVALDASTGKQVWKTYLVDEPKPTKKNAAGAQLWGPSGVPVWSTPVVDRQRNALYVTTGNNYSDPTSTLSDAFVALDLASEKILWSRQMTTADAYTWDPLESTCRHASLSIL